MDVGTMRQNLRDIMEVEAEDWPDVMIDASLAEGYARIIAREQRWPFLEDAWQFVTQPAQGTYPAELLNGLREVSAVRVGTRRLTYVDTDEAEVRYGSATGSSVQFSRWGGNLLLWPAPSDESVVDVRGYRAPSSFQSLAGYSPDLPDEFHSLLMDWALANEYQRQDDIEMSQSYRQKFEEQLTTLHKAALATPAAGPVVVGGSRRRYLNPDTMPYIGA